MSDTIQRLSPQHVDLGDNDHDAIMRNDPDGLCIWYADHLAVVARKQGEIASVIAGIPQELGVHVCENNRPENLEATLAVAVTKMSRKIDTLMQQLKAARKPLTDELTFWVVEQFEDGNGRSLGYWTGHNSRDFTPNILDAIQFCRKDDALIAKSSWHWKDCEVTEHKWIASRTVPEPVEHPFRTKIPENEQPAEAAQDDVVKRIVKTLYALVEKDPFTTYGEMAEAVVLVAREGYVPASEIYELLAEYAWTTGKTTGEIAHFIRKRLAEPKGEHHG